MSEQTSALENIIKGIDAGVAVSSTDRTEVLDLLEAYECWTPLFKVLEQEIRDRKSQNRDSYIRLARVQYLYNEDIFAAAETCALAVQNLKLRYRDVVEYIIPALFENEDFACEATFIHALVDKFEAKEDKIAALERLSLLYEKKTLNENHLNETYTTLLELDSLNIKALRYFKVLFTQNYEWEKVIVTLRSLIDASKHPRDVFRVAQELAAVLLYQLDQPRDAISVVSAYCDGSPLDTSTITYDSYQRLGDWRGCLKVLRECLLSVGDDTQRAVIHYRIGQLEEKVGQVKNSYAEYERVIALNPNFFEAYEQLIALHLKANNWQEALKFTDLMLNKITDESERAHIIEARDRLAAGLKHASQG